MKSSRLFCLMAMVAALVFFTAPASAGIITLTHQNSQVFIDNASSSGMFSWTVDGQQQMFQQWFWYRVGNGAEASIDTLPLISSTGAGRMWELTYGSTNGLTIDVLYTLTGGLAGSQTGDVAETITLSNAGAAALDLHFFQYSDFDLGGTPSGDTVVFTNNNTVRQTGDAFVLSETVVTPPANHRESDLYPATLNRLQDGVATTLADTPLWVPLSGDVTWAFQWDTVINPGGSFIISKDKNLRAAVPEPMTILGLGTILLIVGRRLSKKVV